MRAVHALDSGEPHGVFILAAQKSGNRAISASDTASGSTDTSAVAVVTDRLRKKAGRIDVNLIVRCPMRGSAAISFI